MSAKPILAKELSVFQEQGVKHGFFTRQGGVSEGIYQSLNVGQGSNDQSDHVLLNRQYVAEYFGVLPNNLINAYQFHSAEALIVNAPFVSERPKADALVTKQKNLAIGVLTADCGPVLFCDPIAGVIGAAHAGWRGALYGILENTILQMETLGARRQNITAVLGPTIGPQNYEVSTEFQQIFISENAHYSKFFTLTQKPNHYLFNLWAFIIERLNQAKVRVSCLELCTYEHDQDFFSYRRKIHKNEADYGRQISAIMMSS